MGKKALEGCLVNDGLHWKGAWSLVVRDTPLCLCIVYDMWTIE